VSKGRATDRLQVGVHGLIVNFTDPATLQPRTATFLPEVRIAKCTLPWNLLQVTS
jgi:AMMECR1 domain-containing protein